MNLHWYHLGFAPDYRGTGLPDLDLDATGWISDPVCKNCHETNAMRSPTTYNRENTVCVQCHNVHGTNTPVGSIHDEMGYTRTTTANGNSYGTMKPEAYGIDAGGYSLDNYPTYCRNNCHSGNRNDQYFDWPDPLQTRSWFNIDIE